MSPKLKIANRLYTYVLDVDVYGLTYNLSISCQKFPSRLSAYVHRLSSPECSWRLSLYRLHNVDHSSLIDMNWLLGQILSGDKQQEIKHSLPRKTARGQRITRKPVIVHQQVTPRPEALPMRRSPVVAPRLWQRCLSKNRTHSQGSMTE